MASSLILHKRINTTVSKAKELRKYVEPLITKAKDDTTHSRRTVFSYLQNKEAVGTLFREVAAKIGDRPGGYTRILKTGNRLGDKAEMCMMELVDFNEILLGTGETKKAKTTRRSGSRKKSTAAAEGTTDAPAAESAPEAKAEAAPKKKAAAKKKKDDSEGDKKED